MNMQDKTLTCRDCGEQFTFTVGEQEFYAEKGFTNEPSRCPACRAANKANRGGGGGGGRSRDRQMYSAVCSECGKQTEVPFEPRGDRPVYCSDCFALRRSNGGGDDYGRSSRDSRGGRSGGGNRSRGGRGGRSEDRW
jgi:CxxC-x17-CxxC domain-containing protein